MNEADIRDRQLWSEAKRMYRAQTSGLPVRPWEKLDESTRLVWRKLAQAASEKGPRRTWPTEARLTYLADLIMIFTAQWLDKYSATPWDRVGPIVRRINVLDARYIRVEDALVAVRHGE